MRFEDLDHGVILDPGKQPDNILTGGGVHAKTLALGPVGSNQENYRLATKHAVAGSSGDKSNYLLSNAGRSFMMTDVRKVHNYLHGARVYLAGPMDFVASRETEKRFGWRSRVKEFLERLGVTVFDPWEKPRIRGLLEYGKEDAKTIKNRDRWTFAATAEGAATRAELAEYFWETVHIDLRMVDISDFVIAYCPTDIYSVGTVHEIIVARSQHKPVLFVSPPTEQNPSGTPSLWYLPLIGSESFFDGFGFREKSFLDQFENWREKSPLDERELERPPERPLLPYLDELGRGTSVPKRWVHATRQFQDDDDWLLLEESLR